MKMCRDDLRDAPGGWRRVYWPAEAIALPEQGGVTDISSITTSVTMRAGQATT